MKTPDEDKKVVLKMKLWKTYFTLFKSFKEGEFSRLNWYPETYRTYLDLKIPSLEDISPDFEMIRDRITRENNLRQSEDINYQVYLYLRLKVVVPLLRMFSDTLFEKTKPKDSFLFRKLYMERGKLEADLLKKDVNDGKLQEVIGRNTSKTKEGFKGPTYGVSTLGLLYDLESRAIRGGLLFNRKGYVDLDRKEHKAKHLVRFPVFVKNVEFTQKNADRCNAPDFFDYMNLIVESGGRVGLGKES